MEPDGALLQLLTRAEHPWLGQVLGLLGQELPKRAEFPVRSPRPDCRMATNQRCVAPRPPRPWHRDCPARLRQRRVSYSCPVSQRIPPTGEPPPTQVGAIRPWRGYCALRRFL